jgi:hypothetical protein
MEVFKLFVFISCFMGSDACDTIVFPETLNGCTFSDLTLVNPKTGFVVAGVNCGLEVYKSTFYDQPFVFFAGASDKMKYTLVMVDKDNPDCDDDDMYLHWLVTDIDGQSLKYGLGVYGGKTVAGEGNSNQMNLQSPFVFQQLTFHLIHWSSPAFTATPSLSSNNTPTRSSSPKFPSSAPTSTSSPS